MTSDRLLDIAIREFGAKGLEGASTRGIAAAAGTAMSAITYHYGGKQGLYLASAERIAMLMAARMDEAHGRPGDRADGVSGDDRDPADARSAVVDLLLHMTDMMASPDADAWSLFIAREQMHPTEAFERIYAGGMGPLLSRLARLVGHATGAGPRACCIAAMTMFAQPLSLRVCRATFVRLLDATRLSDEDLGATRTRIAANTHAILDRLSAEARDTP